MNQPRFSTNGFFRAWGVAAPGEDRPRVWKARIVGGGNLEKETIIGSRVTPGSQVKLVSSAGHILMFNSFREGDFSYE